MKRMPCQIAVSLSRRSIARLLFFVLLACLGQPVLAQTDQSEVSPAIPIHLMPAVEQAIANGRDMYAGYQFYGGRPEEKGVQRGWNIDSATERYCDDRAYRPLERHGPLFYIYLLAGPMPPFERDEQGGLAIRTALRMSSVGPPPEDCVIVSLRNDSIRLLTTRMSTPTPTEVDVFESLKGRKSLYLSSSDGTVWWVRGDSITIVN